MTDDEDTPAPPPAPKSRFRWLRKLAAGALGLLLLVGGVLFLARWQTGRLGQRQLDATVQRLDREEQDWRLDALLAARAKPPEPKDDAAAEVLDIARRVPPEWMEWQRTPAVTDWFRAHPDNRLPPAPSIAAAEKLVEPTRVPRARALLLRDKKGGVYPLEIAPDPLATTLPHLDSARRVLGLLQFDAQWETYKGNPNRGVEAARACLAVARSIGDEPLLISQLVRMACANVAARTAVQVLAWGEPTDGLAELQAELLAEAEVPWFRLGMRGERAMLDKVFEGLENGTIPPENLFRHADVGQPGPQHFAAFRTYKALLPGDRAKCLQVCSEYIAASKLPPEEQVTAIKKVEIPGRPPEEFRYLVTRLLMPACQQFAEAGLRTRAELLTAAACVACERFRRKHGRFPNDLAELAPAFLPQVPQNPFDGRPLSYRVHADRVVVFGVRAGSRPLDTDPPELRLGETDVGVGYRLWAPEVRRAPAPVEAKPPDEKMDP